MRAFRLCLSTLALGLVACGGYAPSDLFATDGSTGGDGGVIGSDGGGGNDATPPPTDGGGNDGSTCTVKTLAASPIPAAMFLLHDRSSSMLNNVGGVKTRWTEQRDGTNTFAGQPESARHLAALMFHPATNSGDQCQGSLYQTALEPFGVLSSGTATNIATKLASAAPNGNSPWSAGLKGALAQVKAEQAAHPDRNYATVFFADDFPTACDTDIANQIIPLVQGYQEPMFVIGYGAPQTYAQDKARFDSIAVAGKTGAAFVPNPTTAAGVTGALAEIRDRIGCDVALPLDGGNPIDPSKYDLALEVNGAPVPMAQVKDAAACTKADEWYPKAKDRVGFCFSACRKLDDPTAKVAFKSRCN
jgi:hypothetical protein